MEIKALEQILSLVKKESKIEFKDKVFLAPMVRGSTFPLRVLSLIYGADAVFNQELIDRLVMRLVRKTDQTTNLVNFLSPDKNHSIFTTFIGEPVVFQLGTADAVNALKAVKVVQRDIKAVDINMGCPFKFSVAGGMGAALLRKPEVVRDIVQTLKRNIDVPVTCKVRVLENVDESLELVRRIEKSGADAITLRPHYVSDRRRFPARIDLIRPLTEVLNIPTIYNGDIFDQSSIPKAKSLTNCDSVMIARGALWNPSVFDKNGFSPLSDVVPMYARIAMLSNHRWSYTKYCLTTMLKGSKINCESFKLLLSAKSLDDLEPFLVELEKEALSSKTLYDWKKGCKGVKTSFFYLDSLNKKIKYEDLKFD